MKIYCDTSVLVAASVVSHPHHVQSTALLKQIRSGTMKACMSAHGTAEFYAVMTRAPLTPMIHPSEAWRILVRNILPYFQVVALTSDQYQSVLEGVSLTGWTGGIIYDALHLEAAKSSQCQRIYTHNIRHFQKLAPELQDKICSP